MPNVTLQKEAGIVTSIAVIHEVARYHYGNDFDGCSSHWGTDNDLLAIHLLNSPIETKAEELLSDIELPTCTSSGLDITVNCGALLVGDVTNITADLVDVKYILVKLSVDVTDGSVNVYACEKTTEENYPDAPGDFPVNVKEYSLVAAGTTLVEIKDYIE